MKINIGYMYELTGDIDIDLSAYEVFCKDNEVEPYNDVDLNFDSVKEFLLERHDLVHEASGGGLQWVSR